MTFVNAPQNAKRIKIVDPKAQPVTRADYMMRTLRASGEPLTSAVIAARCHCSIRITRKVLRWLMDQGDVEKRTRWSGSHSYTWVYRIKEGR